MGCFLAGANNGTYRELNKGTFEQYIEHWKATHLLPGQYKPSTLNSYRCNLARLILPEFGIFNIASISSAEINSFTAKLLSKNQLSPKTVVNTLNLLSRIFNDAISDNYLRHSPMQGSRNRR